MDPPRTQDEPESTPEQAKQRQREERERQIEQRERQHEQREQQYDRQHEQRERQHEQHERDRSEQYEQQERERQLPEPDKSSIWSNRLIWAVPISIVASLVTWAIHVEQVLSIGTTHAEELNRRLSLVEAGGSIPLTALREQIRVIDLELGRLRGNISDVEKSIRTSSERPSQLELAVEASRKSAERILIDWILRARITLEEYPADAKLVSLVRSCPIIPSLRPSC